MTPCWWFGLGLGELKIEALVLVEDTCETTPKHPNQLVPEICFHLDESVAQVAPAERQAEEKTTRGLHCFFSCWCDSQRMRIGISRMNHPTRGFSCKGTFESVLSGLAFHPPSQSSKRRTLTALGKPQKDPQVQSISHSLPIAPACSMVSSRGKRSRARQEGPVSTWGSLISLGPPARCPFSPRFWLGGFPYYKEKNRVPLF